VNKPLFHTIILFVCIAIIAAARIFRIDVLGLYFFGLKWPMHCLLHSVFDVKCAFCGMTRSFIALANGDLAAALQYHFLGPVFFAFTVFQIPYRIWALAISPRRVNIKIRKAHNYFAVIILAAILVNWLIYLGGRLT